MSDSFDVERKFDERSVTPSLQSVSARTLTVPRLSKLTAADPATSAATNPDKGGKGGDGGEPSLPPSNATFLAGVVRDVEPDARAVVCSKPGDPADGGWYAAVADDVDRQCPGDHNNYFNCSSFVADEDGGVNARVDRFGAYHVLVLDDVGTKVDRAKLTGVTPTWEVETSPGNSQVGFRLSDPLRDPAQVGRLQGAVMAAGLCDRGAGGPARWMRLPNAINGKAAHRDDIGKPFICRLVTWNPDVAFTIDELVTLLRLDVDSVPEATVRAATPPHDRGDDVFKPTPYENPVLTALRARGLYKRPIKPGAHDITCPWLEEHTDNLDGGTAYFEPDAAHPVGGFCCKHGHCNGRHISELLAHLDMKPDQARGKARIDIVPGEMNRVRRAAEQTLARVGGYYQAGGAIVVIRTDPGTGDVATELLGEAALTSALSDAADCIGSTAERESRFAPTRRRAMSRRS